MDDEPHARQYNVGGPSQWANMTTSELLTTYLNDIEPLIQAVQGLTAEQLQSHPIAGTWSILEVVCHLADSEGLFAERMKRVLTEDRPTMLLAQPDRYVAMLAYQQRVVVEELAYISAVRQQMHRILQSQPSEAWQQVGIHSKEGERTLEQIVRKAVDHFEHHLGFIRAKRKALNS